MASSSLDLDELIARLLSFKPDKRTACLTEEELRTVCDECKEVLLSQPSLLELAAPIRVLGDIHGQYNDLLRLFGMRCLSEPNIFPAVVFSMTSENRALHAEFGGLPPASNYLFMGDYVDRGEYGYVLPAAAHAHTHYPATCAKLVGLVAAYGADWR